MKVFYFEYEIQRSIKFWFWFLYLNVFMLQNDSFKPNSSRKFARTKMKNDDDDDDEDDKKILQISRKFSANLYKVVFSVVLSI